MMKLDSFIKESERVHGCSSLRSVRKVMSDSFTFSDGTVLPKGTNLSTISRALNQDKDIYPNPYEFQGFRFAEKEDKKYRMTAITDEFITFGIGRHACPGRFFAITEVKTILARLILEYDIGLGDGMKERPENNWFIGLEINPNMKASLEFRKL